MEARGKGHPDMRFILWPCFFFTSQVARKGEERAQKDKWKINLQGEHTPARRCVKKWAKFNHGPGKETGTRGKEKEKEKKEREKEKWKGMNWIRSINHIFCHGHHLHHRPLVVPFALAITKEQLNTHTHSSLRALAFSLCLFPLRERYKPPKVKGQR